MTPVINPTPARQVLITVNQLINIPLGQLQAQTNTYTAQNIVSIIAQSVPTNNMIFSDILQLTIDNMNNFVKFENCGDYQTQITAIWFQSCNMAQSINIRIFINFLLIFLTIIIYYSLIKY